MHHFYFSNEFPDHVQVKNDVDGNCTTITQVKDLRGTYRRLIIGAKGTWPLLNGHGHGSL